MCNVNNTKNNKYQGMYKQQNILMYFKNINSL